MALSLPLGPRLGSEPLNHPPGAPREADIVGCTVCPASGEESTSPEQAQTLGQDSLGPPEHFQGGPRGNEPAAHPPRWSTPSSYEDPAGGKHCEEADTSHSRQDMLESGLGHQKRLARHQRHSLLRKPQDKKRQASPHLQDVRLEGNPGAPDPASRQPLTFLLILFLLFLLLVGAMFLLPASGGPCCSHARIPRTPYLVLSYVNGLPPV
ncbi:nesprin-4 isoform X8 [Homo sapiens]|uniref:nesprin-4 isoform X8 n=1 Tax=Homo sapiens TaxID=9606 RepID=UPI000020216F|nr:nesprin-4 isoform X8 [Homo sapiens]XP_054176067.1 nesprin-4 isoform X8 [Homo sapiens]